MVIEEGLLDDGDWVYSPQLIACTEPCEGSIEHAIVDIAKTNLNNFFIRPSQSEFLVCTGMLPRMREGYPRKLKV
jgi:hypothetical protein